MLPRSAALLLEGETIEVATPLRTIALAEPGEYRVEVATPDVLALSIYAGAATLVTDGGPLPVAAGQRVQLPGRHAAATLAALPPTDAFDDWVERESPSRAARQAAGSFLAAAGGHAVLRRYSKAPEQPFAPGERGERLAFARREYRDEIARGLAWIGRLARADAGIAALAGAGLP